MRRRPVFRHELTTDLEKLGVLRGDTLLVHAAMSAVGWVCGGATEVVGALLDVVGGEGNIVVPAQTPDNRDPGRWQHYSPGQVPEAWWPALREHLPAFDPRLTPSAGMGVIAERVRTWPGAERSDHPQTSFAAIGPDAGWLMAGHLLESQLGEESPLARLEEKAAKVLLIGVGFDKCTAFHLAEYRQERTESRDNACVVQGADGPAWVRYTTIRLDDSDFTRLGHDLETETAAVRAGPLGEARSRLFGLADAVAFAQEWLPRHRPSGQW